MDAALDRTVRALTAGPPVPFGDTPDASRYYYAVWVDHAGARELSDVSPEPVPPGVVYAGQCVTQSLNRHLRHSDIGSLTLMKALAALFRERWQLVAERRGGTLHDRGGPGYAGGWRHT